MAMIAARLQVLEALEAENVRLRAFIARVGGAYDIADISELQDEASAMSREWA